MNFRRFLVNYLIIIINKSISFHFENHLRDLKKNRVGYELS